MELRERSKVDQLDGAKFIDDFLYSFVMIIYIDDDDEDDDEFYLLSY